MPDKPGWWWRDIRDHDWDPPRPCVCEVNDTEGPSGLDYAPTGSDYWKPVLDDGRWLAPVLTPDEADALRRERDEARALAEHYARIAQGGA